MLCFNLFGQTIPEVQFSTVQNQEQNVAEESRYLLADRVYLRNCDGTSCKKRGVLAIGTKLTVLEKSEKTLVINGIQSNWYKVRTQDNEGWIWGGFIAQKSFGSQANADIKFVFGRESTAQDSTGFLTEYYQLRAFKNGVELDKIVFAAPTLQPFEVKSIGNRGVYNLEDIITLHIPCMGGCGCTTGDMYVFYNNNKFNHVATLTGFADAEYSENETFIFPSDMEGKKGLIIKKSNRIDEQYLLDGDESKVRRKVLTTFYKWSAGKLIETSIAPVVASYDINI